MSLHETIVADLHGLIDDHAGADIISPASVALALQQRYGLVGVHAAINYGSLQHFKQMARQALRGRFDSEGDLSEAYQGELFSGHLQVRYPVPHKQGDDPTYKLRESLTDAEVRWNVQALQRSADARMKHARALEAWRQSRVVAA